jgi:hypothetical protein
MSRTKAPALLLAVSLALFATPAFAQKDEPLPPGQQNDSEAPPLSSAPRSYTPPPYVDPNAPVVAPPTAKFDPLDWKNSIAVYGRYLFITNLMLKPYLNAATQMNTWALGLQYIRRYEHFDVVTSLDFSWLQLDNGNYLAKGNSPELDTHYVQFDKLSMLSADVAIVGHHAFNNWLELRGGAGLGLGVVFGKVYTTNDSNQVCTKQTAPHESQCYPISPTSGPIYLNQKGTNAQLAGTTDSSKLDTAQDPHRNKAFVPPVMGVLDIFMALNFRLHRNVSTQLEVGFRDAMFVGTNLQYHF